MKPSIKYGLYLGFFVAGLGFLFPTVGLHTVPQMATVFILFAATANVILVFFALNATADTAAWEKQVLNALVMGTIGAVLIFAGSWLMATLVYPDYYAEYAEGFRQSLAATGPLTDEMKLQVEALAQTSPVTSALSGAIGTIATSVVAGAIIGIFRRKR